MTRPKFVVPVAPLPGESLAGVVARAAHENLITSPVNLFSHLGMPIVRLGSIATRHADKCDDLAYLIGARPDDLRPLFYKRADRYIAGLGAEINFLGAHLALRCREPKIRRLSPASLRVSAYHRAAWELRFLHWCPESLEYLLGECPSCGRSFGWAKLAGIHICENCGEDIRDQESKCVAECDKDTARLLSDLILNRDEATRIRMSLHEDLRQLVDADLLCLALMLASGFEWSPKRVHDALYDMDRATAPSLEIWRTGFERLGRWPTSAYEIIGAQLDAPKEDAGYGMIEELGPVAAHLMPVNADLAKILRAAIAGHYKQNGVIALRPIGSSAEWYRPGWLPAIEAKKKYRLSDWTMEQALRSPDVRRITHERGERSPSLLHEEDLLRWLEKLKAALDVLTVMRRIGVPEHAVWELIELGHLKLLTSETRILNPRKGFIEADSVTALGDAVFARCAPMNGDDEDRVLLSEAVECSPSPASPWTTAIGCILSGKLPVWRHQGSSSVCVDALLVRREQFEAEISRNVVLPDLKEAPHLMTYNDAAILLRVSADEIVRLTREQKIDSESGGAGRRSVRRSVYRYAMAQLNAGSQGETQCVSQM
ncbi:MAG: TniQ family protein [Parvibaculum sp.]